LIGVAIILHFGTTLHLPPDLSRILRAEALAQGKTVSGLLEGWIDERLDLPEKESV